MSCSTNESIRARDRPCTSTLTRPSAIRSTRITVTTAPTRYRSSGPGSSISPSRCAVEQQQPIARERVLDRRDRAVARHEQRQHHVREDHHLPQREDGQLLGDRKARRAFAHTRRFVAAKTRLDQGDPPLIGVLHDPAVLDAEQEGALAGVAVRADRDHAGRSRGTSQFSASPSRTSSRSSRPRASCASARLAAS